MIYTPYDREIKPTRILYHKGFLCLKDQNIVKKKSSEILYESVLYG